MSLARSHPFSAFDETPEIDAGGPNSSSSSSPSFPPPTAPLPPLPSTHRRHSITPRSRPLRSSPLTGPAFSSEGLTSKWETDDASDGGKPNYRPSRISSTPELGSHRGFPSPHELRRKISDSRIAASGFFMQDQTGKHNHFRSSRHSKRKAENDIPIPLTPPIPEWALQDITSAHNPFNTTAEDTIPPSPTTPPSPRLSPDANRISHPYSQDVANLHNSSPDALSRDPSQNWVTRVPYSTTPRFSRLSLASPDVVLPVSAHSHKRSLSRTSSRTSSSRTSISSFGSGSDSENFNHTISRGSSFILGQSSSNVSRLGSTRPSVDALSIDITNGPTPNANDFSVQIEEVPSDLPSQSFSHDDSGVTTKRISSLPKLTWRLKPKSKPDLETSLHGVSQLSFLSFSESEKSFTDKPPRAVPVLEQRFQSQWSHGFEGSEKTGSVKRLWRKFSTARRR